MVRIARYLYRDVRETLAELSAYNLVDGRELLFFFRVFLPYIRSRVYEMKSDPRSRETRKHHSNWSEKNFADAILRKLHSRTTE